MTKYNRDTVLGKDLYHGAFKAAAEATKARIRRDRRRAPDALKKLLAVLASRVLDPLLDATVALKAAGFKGSGIGTVFKGFTKTTPARYIADARIEVADLALVITGLDLASISKKVGYTHYPTFAENYQRRKGKKPFEVARPRLAPPRIDLETSLKAGRGLLDDDALVRLVEDLRRIYPTAAKRFGGGDHESPIPVEGARTDRSKAEALWREIRDLPFAEQCRRVRIYLFCSTVLFDLLRRKSRLEGRKSRRRGVELAELALISLEKSDRVFGERIHDLRARGLADLGNAYRLALDFSAAAEAFERAEREWLVPSRARPDLSVFAHIRLRKSALLMVRREYVEATQDVSQSCALFQQLDQPRDKALALIQRAAIHGYAGKLGEAVEDLRKAAGLIDEEEESELTFAIRSNLANALALAGEAEDAVKELDRARQLRHAIDDSLGALKLAWIDGLLGEIHGDLEKAQRCYQGAGAGFREADERRYYALVSVDLMIVHAEQDDWQRAGALAAETLPLLSSLNLHPETLTTVALLAKAVEAGGLSRRLLHDLRTALRQDPLAM